MSHTDAEQTTPERKPPTIADIVREKTDDGRLIIDFFTDVMMDRIDGAELCHRIDAAKQLVKYGSKAAAEFLAKYKGVPCGHSINGRPNPADPCTAEDRSLVAVTLNAPPTLTQEFLTVLSGIDEFLMARLIRAQTADAGTIIEFLDDVMQDRTEGFKTHHRIAAAKELIVHIVRDEQPAPTPREPEPSSTVIPAKAGIQRSGGPGATRPSKAGVHPDPNSSVVPAQAGTQGSGGGRSAAANPARTEPVLSTAEGSAHPELNSSVVPAKAGTQGGSGARSTPANPTHPDPNSPVVPATAGTQGSGGARSTAANPAHPEPNSSVVPAPTAVVPPEAGTHPRPRQVRREPVESSQLETNNSKLKTLPAERRIKEKLEQHWHEPDPHGAPIDSTHPGRSPPR